MKTPLASLLTIVALCALAAPAAFAGTDAAGSNHYILRCSENCLLAGGGGTYERTITPDFTGAWFDPSQSEQGLFLEILPNRRAQGYWFTFDPLGTAQAWFSGTGPTWAQFAQLTDVTQPTGGRWIPNFNASSVVARPWGSMVLSFSDANNGKVDFTSTSGYGSGTMYLTRLTKPTAASDLGWSRTGALNVPRVGHRATLLPNGKVLAVGGFEAVGSPPFGHVLDDPDADTAELYDPVTGSWSFTGKPNLARGEGITATLLQDGNVLVTGGWSGCTPACAKPSTSAEIYEVSTGTWHLTGSMGVARSGHSATLLRDGKVLVVGGASAELYDPMTGTWSDTGALHSERSGHSALLLQDGKVLVFGGHAFDNDWGGWIPATTYELYDPSTGKWTSYDGPSGGSFYSHGEAVLLSDGSVLSAGGEGADYYAGSQDAFVFDPATLAWTRTAALANARYGHTTTVLRNGDVLVTGGAEIYNTLAAGAERFDVLTKQWVSAGRLITPRSGHSATLLADGSVLFAGGYAPARSRESELFVDVRQPPSTIRPGFTGSWYDPAQSGHGLHLEVLPDNRLLAAWFTFDPAGSQQAWFLGMGTYSGNTATVEPVLQPVGGRWIPNFNPADVVNRPWGMLNLTFTDCNHGRVDFSSTVPGYGSGSMNLTRLTQAAGLDCP